MQTTGVKNRPEQFGGGRPAAKQPYTEIGIRRLMCSRRGCSREAYATWGACADENIQRPLCPECDVQLNELALAFMGDPDARGKLEDYKISVEKRIGRPLFGGKALFHPVGDWAEIQALAIAGR